VSLGEYVPVIRAIIVLSKNSPLNVHSEDEGTFIPRIVRIHSPTGITSRSEILSTFLHEIYKHPTVLLYFDYE